MLWGFVLFEAMVATAIFAIAVIGLARSVEAGLSAGLAGLLEHASGA